MQINELFARYAGDRFISFSQHMCAAQLYKRAAEVASHIRMRLKWIFRYASRRSTGLSAIPFAKRINCIHNACRVCSRFNLVPRKYCVLQIFGFPHLVG